MRQIGRFQLHLRELLLVTAILPISSWLAAEIHGESAHRKYVAALHKQEAMHYKGIAESEILDHHTMFAMDMNRVCRRVEYPMAEAEMTEAKRIRERAGGLLAYHLALQHKYERAAYFPWLPVAPDPPQQQ